MLQRLRVKKPVEHCFKLKKNCLMLILKSKKFWSTTMVFNLWGPTPLRVVCLFSKSREEKTMKNVKNSLNFYLTSNLN